MLKLFVDKKIEIHASTSKVWEAITKRENSNQWAVEFSSGDPQFHIESDWELGSSVLWKGKDGIVYVDGLVTACEKNRILRFTVLDVRSSKRIAVNEEDGITFRLDEENGKTILHILHGDFSPMADGEKYRDASTEIWDKVLPKIKELAEK